MLLGCDVHCCEQYFYFLRAWAVIKLQRALHKIQMASSEQSINFPFVKHSYARKHVSPQTVHNSRACFPMFPSFTIRETLLPESIVFPRCKLCYYFTMENFNENTSMRGVAKKFRARAEQARTRLFFASNRSKGHILRAHLNWMGPFHTLLLLRFSSNVNQISTWLRFWDLRDLLAR